MVCPVCTVAVGAGVGALRVLGLDDLIIGLWIGALIVSSIAWTLDFLNRKNITFLFKKITVVFGFYALFLIPLYYMHIIGLEGNTFFGIDKILFGAMIGSIVFLVSVYFEKYLRKHNDGKVLFYYQKVIIPLLFLIFISIILYLLVEIAKW